MNSTLLNPYHLLLTKVLETSDIVDPDRDFEVIPSEDTMEVLIKLPLIGSLWSDYTEKNRSLLLKLCRELVGRFRENIGKELSIRIELVDETDYVFVFTYNGDHEEEPTIEELQSKTLYFQGVLNMEAPALLDLLRTQNEFRELGCNILDLSDLTQESTPASYSRLIEAAYKRIQLADEVIVNNDTDYISQQELVFAMLLRKPIVLCNDRYSVLRTQLFKGLLEEYGIKSKP